MHPPGVPSAPGGSGPLPPGRPAPLPLFEPPGSAGPDLDGQAPARQRRPRRPPPLLLAVDGNGLAHRAWHAAGGQDAPLAAARQAFLRLLLRVAAAARPTACVVGFDDPEPGSSLRRAAHPSYKAGRPPKPPGLAAFLDELPALLDDLGLAVVVPAGLEADDVLGSAAWAAERRGAAATLATGDRDAFALVTASVAVWWLRDGGRVEPVSPSWLRARYGVLPAAWPDLAALCGDPSDALPGVTGVGPVTAARLLAAYPDVHAALADPEGLARLVGERAARALAEQRATYERNRQLMAIRRDLPLDLAASARPLRPAAVRAALDAAGAASLARPLLRAFELLGRAWWRRASPAPAPLRAGARQPPSL